MKRKRRRVDSFLKEHSKINESSNLLVNLPERIQVEVSEKYSVTNRVYKLLESVFEMKLAEDKHKVRDIIINHIDEKYYNKILDKKEPREILAKLKEYKRLETKVTSVSARKDLYEIRYNLKREKTVEFWDKFEEKIRMYENVPDAGKMPEKEQRDIFMHAGIDAVPGIEVLNCLNRQTTGNDVPYQD